MKLEVSLRVALKAADPVISTAYLTLVEKMGYRDKLLALNRLESYSFSISCADPAPVVRSLTGFLATQSTFYNRNKHMYFLECSWEGGRHTEGARVEQLESLDRQVARWSKLDEPQDLDGQATRNRVMLKDVAIYRSEILVEDIDADKKVAVGRGLETELATAPVTVAELGVRWYLALRVDSKKEARSVTREIVVTESRGRGLLLNPNHQQYNLLSLREIDL
ncbi:MAG: hypothetical protein OEN01_04495 [Candidatus Krumholzibacteria bacterium]|nr:hypothetical protein [Candidatus Krumholzibacteria bacterium]